MIRTNIPVYPEGVETGRFSNLMDYYRESKSSLNRFFTTLFKESGLNKYETFDHEEATTLLRGGLRVSTFDNLIICDLGGKQGLEITIKSIENIICTYTKSTEEILDFVKCLSIFAEEANKFGDVTLFLESLGRWQFLCFVYENILKEYPDALLDFSSGEIYLPSQNYFPISIQDTFYEKDDIVYEYMEESGLQISATVPQFAEAKEEDIQVLKEIKKYLLMSMFNADNYQKEIMEGFLTEVAELETEEDKEIFINELSSILPIDITEVAITCCLYYKTNRRTEVYFKFRDKYYFYNRKKKFTIFYTPAELFGAK